MKKSKFPIEYTMDDISLKVRFTLKQLAYFASVARTGQVSLAASESHISQSAMTAAVADLEKQLGIQLFERSRTGMSLTHQGHIFLQQAVAVLDAAMDAARYPLRSSGDVEGTLVIAASYSVLGYFLLPAIAKFKRLHPLVDIAIEELSHDDIESGVGNGDLEVGVTTSLNCPERLEVARLASSRRQLWVASQHPLSGLPTAHWADIAQHVYVLLTVDGAEARATEWMRTSEHRPKSFLHTSSMEALREMVSLGLGVTILSDMVFRPWSLDGRHIRAVPLAEPVPPMEIALIAARNRQLSHAAQAFHEFLVPHFTQRAAAGAFSKNV